MIYFIQESKSKTGPVKIGYTDGNLGQLRQRLACVQVGNYRELVVIAIGKGGREREQELHARFEASRLRGEWFSLSAELRDVMNPLRLTLPLSTRMKGRRAHNR